MQPDEYLHIDPAIDTLIWDLDGTILDSFDYSLGLWCQVIVAHGFKAPSREVFARNYHGSVYDTARGLTPEATDEQINAIIMDFFELDNQHITDVDQFLFPDAVDLLRRVHEKGLRQIVVTNRPHGTDRGNASPRTMINNSLLKNIVQEVVCGDEVVERKPSAHAVDALHIVPERTLVIGDQSVDGQFAANMGSRAIIICRTADSSELHEQEISKAHCESISSLERVIFN